MSWRSLTEALATAIGEDVQTILASLAGKRNNKNAVVTLTNMATDMVERVDIESDNTATAGWGNRLEYRFKPFGGTARNVLTLNEYGEPRITPAKPNTVAFRLFAREYQSDPARDMSVPLVEIYNDRDNRVTQWAVYGDGDMYVGKDLEVVGNVVADNIGVPILGVYDAGSEPTGVPTGTIILVRP